MEAIETVDEWWRALFGDDFDPPFLIPKELENFDSDFNRLVELDAKKQEGTLTEEEKQELEDLESWFATQYDPELGIIPEAERNKNYKKKQLNHCS